MSSRSKRKRPDGLIQVSCTINGKRRYFYGHTRTEACKKRDDYKLRQIAKVPEVPHITVAEWVQQYLSTYRTGVNEAYIQIDNVPYNRLIAAYGDRPLETITEADLQQSLNGLANKSFSTCRNYKQTLCRVFKKAHHNRLITHDPAADLKLPCYTKGTHRALEQWEISAILKYWNAPGQWAGIWIMIMLLCGLRRGEMMALDWKNVDMAARVLSVRQVAVVIKNQTIIEDRAKTAAGIRCIPICAPLYDALNSVPENKRKGFVCLSCKGLQLSETAVGRGLEKSFKIWSDLTDRTLSFRTHDLRHTYATMLYESGVDVKVAQYLLGHADMRMTLQLYTHLSNGHRSRSEAILINYLNNLSTNKIEP